MDRTWFKGKGRGYGGGRVSGPARCILPSLLTLSSLPSLGLICMRDALQTPSFLPHPLSPPLSPPFAPPPHSSFLTQWSITFQHSLLPHPSSPRLTHQPLPHAPPSSLTPSPLPITPLTPSPPSPRSHTAHPSPSLPSPPHAFIPASRGYKISPMTNLTP